MHYKEKLRQGDYKHKVTYYKKKYEKDWKFRKCIDFKEAYTLENWHLY